MCRNRSGYHVKYISTKRHFSHATIQRMDCKRRKINPISGNISFDRLGLIRSKIVIRVT